MPRDPALPLRVLLVLGLFCPSLAPAKTTEVNVVVDFTPEGRKVAHPDPGNPAYYYPVMGKFELGPKQHTPPQVERRCRRPVGFASFAFRLV